MLSIQSIKIKQMQQMQKGGGMENIAPKVLYSIELKLALNQISC